MSPAKRNYATLWTTFFLTIAVSLATNDINVPIIMVGGQTLCVNLYPNIKVLDGLSPLLGGNQGKITDTDGQIYNM